MGILWKLALAVGLLLGDLGNPMFNGFRLGERDFSQMDRNGHSPTHIQPVFILADREFLGRLGRAQRGSPMVINHDLKCGDKMRSCDLFQIFSLADVNLNHRYFLDLYLWEQNILSSPARQQVVSYPGVFPFWEILTLHRIIFPSTDGYPGSTLDVERRALATISYSNVGRQIESFSAARHRNVHNFDIDPRPLIVFRYVICSTGFLECRINQPDSNYTQDHASYGGQSHNLGPQRGSLLRHEIVILAMLVTALVVLFSLCIYQALRLLAAGQGQAGLIGLFTGVAGIFLSVILSGLLVTDLLR